MKIKTPLNVSLFLAAAALVAAPMAQAEVLAEWDFSSDLSPTQEAANVNAQNVTFGSFGGITASGNYGRSGAGSNLFSRIETINAPYSTIIGDSASNAFDNNTYFEFKLGPDSGSLAITDFEAQISAQTISSAGSSLEAPQAAYTIHYALRSDVTGYSNDIATTTYEAPATTDSAGKVFNQETFSSALGNEFSNISSEVTFRLYVWVETDTPTTFQTLRIDSVSFSATPIPEAKGASFMLGAAALLGLFLVRRRLRK